jgi:hypothetical protein
MTKMTHLNDPCIRSFTCRITYLLYHQALGVCGWVRDAHFSDGSAAVCMQLYSLSCRHKRGRPHLVSTLPSTLPPSYSILLLRLVSPPILQTSQYLNLPRAPHCSSCTINNCSPSMWSSTKSTSSCPSP